MKRSITDEEKALYAKLESVIDDVQAMQHRALTDDELLQICMSVTFSAVSQHLQALEFETICMGVSAAMMTIASGLEQESTTKGNAFKNAVGHILLASPIVLDSNILLANAYTTKQSKKS